jgi:hypothetical protein
LATFHRIHYPIQSAPLADSPFLKKNGIVAVDGEIVIQKNLDTYYHFIRANTIKVVQWPSGTAGEETEATVEATVEVGDLKPPF